MKTNEGGVNKPKLLDLYCGAGGAAKGYQRAGFYVVGVDTHFQPHYCGDYFYQYDALGFIEKYGCKFDVIHASPPCQKYTGMANLGKARNGYYPEHPDLIGKTRELLIQTALPYVIENVRGAADTMRAGLMLCGSQFGLHVYRHRLFESNILLWSLPHYDHDDTTPSAGNGKSPKGFISVCGSGGVKGMTAPEIVDYWSYAMGIDWMDREELAEAIPPAYTEFIGSQLINYLAAANGVLNEQEG